MRDQPPAQARAHSVVTPIPHIISTIFTLCRRIARPRALRDSPRYHTIYSIRGLQLACQPLRYRGASPMLLYEPRLLPARTLRGSDRSATLLYRPTS